MKKKKKAATKAVAVVKPEKPLVLTAQHPLSNRQLMYMIQRTPQNHIYERPAKGGGVWQYVTGTYVKKVLNYTFGWAWNFEIKDHGKEGRLIWVLGKLTILHPKTFQPMMIKEQFGRAEAKTKKNSDDYLDYGNDLKAAATDALKKCAAELGIASDVYGKNEFKEVVVTGGNIATQQQAQQAPAQTPKYQPKTPAKSFPKNNVDYITQVKAKLFKLGAKTEKAALALLKNNTGLSWKSFNGISPVAAQRALAELLRK